MNAPTDPASIELGVLAAALNTAIRNADPAQILHCATALDRLARSLAPHQQDAARHAHAAVTNAITALEVVLDRSRHEPRQTRKMRAAYAGNPTQS
jgi:hypothetical protein